jgi:hypothetical protein
MQEKIIKIYRILKMKKLRVGLIAALFIFANTSFEVEAMAWKKIGYGLGTGVAGAATLGCATAFTLCARYYLSNIPQSIRNRKTDDDRFVYACGLCILAVLATANVGSYGLTKAAYKNFEIS